MSIRVSSRVWDTFPGSGSELLAMLALADWCDDAGGNLFPSIAAVAEKIRCSESQARRVVHGLIEAGWLAVVGNSAGGAPGTTRQYRINLAKLTATGGADATPPTGATRKAGRSTGSVRARGSVDATPGAHARDGSHGCAETASTGATQYCHLSVSEPSSSAHARDDDGRLTADEVDRELSGLTRIPESIDRHVLARFARHRRVGRRALSISAWLELLPRFAQLSAEGHDLNESLRQTMAAGLYLPVTPASSNTSTGGKHHVESLADRAARQHDDQRRSSGANASAGGGMGGGCPAGGHSDDFIDVEWRNVPAVA